MIALEIILAFVLTYYASSIIQAVSHRVFGHKRRIDAVFRSHALGHHAVYRRDALLLDHWVAAEKHVMWYFVPLFVPLVLSVYLLAPLSIFVAHMAAIAFSVWWHVFLHKQYHIRGSFFERYKWFMAKRELHLVHHLNVRSNYAIVEYWIDHVMGTIKKPN